MIKTDLRKKAGHTGAPRLKLLREAPVEPEEDTVNPYRMPPGRWFLTFTCMSISIAGWVYLLCLAFGRREDQLRDFAKVYLVYKLIFLTAALIILSILVYIELNLAGKPLAYMEVL